MSGLVELVDQGREPLLAVALVGGVVERPPVDLAHYEVDCETLDRAKEIGACVLDHHVTSVEIRRIHDSAEKRG